MMNQYTVNVGDLTSPEARGMKKRMKYQGAPLREGSTRKNPRSGKPEILKGGRWRGAGRSASKARGARGEMPVEDVEIALTPREARSKALKTRKRKEARAAKARGEMPVEDVEIAFGDGKCKRPPAPKGPVHYPKTALTRLFPAKYQIGAIVKAGLKQDLKTAVAQKVAQKLAPPPQAEYQGPPIREGSTRKNPRSGSPEILKGGRWRSMRKEQPKGRPAAKPDDVKSLKANVSKLRAYEDKISDRLTELYEGPSTKAVADKIGKLHPLFQRIAVKRGKAVKRLRAAEAKQEAKQEDVDVWAKIKSRLKDPNISIAEKTAIRDVLAKKGYGASYMDGIPAGYQDSEKVRKVMGEFKRGKLTSRGKTVTDRKQAVAIALKMAGLSKYEARGAMNWSSYEMGIDLLLYREGDTKIGKSGNKLVLRGGRWRLVGKKPKAAKRGGVGRGGKAKPQAPAKKAPVAVHPKKSTDPKVKGKKAHQERQQINKVRETLSRASGAMNALSKLMDVRVNSEGGTDRKETVSDVNATIKRVRSMLVGAARTGALSYVQKKRISKMRKLLSGLSEMAKEGSLKSILLKSKWIGERIRSHRIGKR